MFTETLNNAHRLTGQTSVHLPDLRMAAALYLATQEAAADETNPFNADEAFTVKALVEAVGGRNISRRQIDKTLSIWLEIGFCQLSPPLYKKENREGDNYPNTPAVAGADSGQPIDQGGGDNCQKSISCGLSPGKPAAVFQLAPIQDAVNGLLVYLAERVMRVVFGSDVPAGATRWLNGDDRAAHIDSLLADLYERFADQRNEAGALAYRIMSDLRRRLNPRRLLNRRHTPLLPGSLAKTNDYLACYARSTIAAGTQATLRADRCAQLGICPTSKTLGNIREKAGIVADADYSERPLASTPTPTPGYIANQANTATRGASERGGGVWLQAGEDRYPLTDSESKDTAYKVCAARMYQGEAVTVIRQLPSIERPATPQEQEKIEEKQAERRAKRRAKYEAQKESPVATTPKPKRTRKPVPDSDRLWIEQQAAIAAPVLYDAALRGDEIVRSVLDDYQLWEVMPGGKMDTFIDHSLPKESEVAGTDPGLPIDQGGGDNCQKSISCGSKQIEPAKVGDSDRRKSDGPQPTYDLETKTFAIAGHTLEFDPVWRMWVAPNDAFAIDKEGRLYRNRRLVCERIDAWCQDAAEYARDTHPIQQRQTNFLGDSMLN